MARRRKDETGAATTRKPESETDAFLRELEEDPDFEEGSEYGEGETTVTFLGEPQEPTSD